MMSKVKNWIQKNRKYFFTIQDGFFELPVLGNSPELMMDSFTSIPFLKNFPEKSYYHTNNLFVKGDAHYQKIEEGLWLIVSDLEIKINLSFKVYYLENEPSEYHFLTLYMNKKPREAKLPHSKIIIENIDYTWTLVKAGSKCLNTHLKGQESIFLNFYISNKWIEQNIASNGIFNIGALKSFFASKSEDIFLHSLVDNNKELYEEVINDFLDKDENKIKDIAKLKTRIYEILRSFTERLDNEANLFQNCLLPDRDKRRIFYAKHLIDNAVFDKFPSVSTIAKQVGASETKVKSDFKSLMGKSMLQYSIQKQMTYAKEMILEKKLAIKDISYSLGYSSPSKFTEAFKKYFDQLPSELNQS